MPFLAPFIAAAGASISATFTAAGLAKVVVGVLINIGLALVQMALTKQLKPEDVRTVFRQSTPTRIRHLGRVRTGGPVLFIESTDRILYQVVYFSEGPMVSVEEYYVDNRVVALDSDGWITTNPYGSNGNQRVQIHTRRGEPSEKSTAYAPLVAAFPGKVNSFWRGDGMATGMISAKTVTAAYISVHYPNRFPELNVLGLFGEPYNPRTGSRAWTDSLPLLLLEYLTDPDGAGISRDVIDLNDFKRAHTVAYQIIPTKGGGSVRRYAGSLSWRLDEPPKDVINRAVMMMDGRLYLKPTGKIGFLIGEWVEPTVHIEDRHIIDAELRDAASPISEANEVVIKWTNPNANFTAATSDPWRNQAAFNRAGGRYRNITVELYGIQSHNHARRIAKIIDHTTNAKWQGTIRTSLVGMLAWDQRFIKVSYSDLGIDEETFEVLSVSMDEEDLTVQLQIASAGSDRYDFNPETEEGTAPVDPESLGDDAIPTPQKLRAEFEATTVKGRRRISATISCDEPPKRGGKKAGDVVVEFAYSAANRNKWRAIAEDEDDFTTEVDNLAEGRLYDFRVRFRTARGEPSNWVVLEDQKAIDPDPPGKPTSVRGTVRNDPLPTGEIITVTAKAPADVQTETLQLWRNRTNAWKGSTLIQSKTVAPGASVVLGDDKPKKGVNYYFVRALNGSDIGGAVAPAINNPLRY